MQPWEIWKLIVVTRSGRKLLLFGIPVRVDEGTFVVTKFVRASILVRWVEVLVQIHSWLVLAWGRRLKLGTIETISGFGKRIRWLVNHFWVELRFSGKVHCIKVKSWARQFFLFFQMNYKQIIFRTHRINMLTFCSSKTVFFLVMSRSRFIIYLLSEDFIYIQFFHITAWHTKGELLCAWECVTMVVYLAWAINCATVVSRRYKSFLARSKTFVSACSSQMTKKSRDLISKRICVRVRRTRTRKPLLLWKRKLMFAWTSIQLCGITSFHFILIFD